MKGGGQKAEGGRKWLPTLEIIARHGVAVGVGCNEKEISLLLHPVIFQILRR